MKRYTLINGEGKRLLSGNGFNNLKNRSISHIRKVKVDRNYIIIDDKLPRYTKYPFEDWYDIKKRTY